MADYLKRAKEKVDQIGKAVSEKMRETTDAAVKLATGNDGALGAAKKALSTREAQLTAAEKMANGGKVKSGKKAR